MPKFFKLAEAESLIPELESLLREALSLKSDYAAAEQAVRAFLERVMAMGGMRVDRGQSASLRSGRDTAAARLRKAIERIQESGCLVKDLDTGLLDFPTLYDGREVYLCWKLGERGIGFWHGVEEGFAGRKPIDDEFRGRHRGDAAQ